MHEDEGYFFWPSRYTPPVGHAGLDVFLTPHPGERLFDTVHMVLQVEESGLAQNVVVNYATNVPDTMHLVPGQLALHAHGGDSFMVLTFGGQVTFETNATCRTCHVRSTAPVFYAGEEGHALTGLMAAQMAVQMARAEADLRIEESELSGLLSSVEPLRLMAIALNEIQHYVNALPDEIRLERYHNESVALTHVIRVLREAGDWPAHVPSLLDLAHSIANRHETQDHD